MAIVMMVESDKEGDPNVRIVRDYHGHEENRISHDYDCPNRHNPEALFELRPSCPARCRALGPLYMETTYTDRVLSLRERNMYDDSDFFAIVWDDETNAPKEIEYASTRGWTYPNHADVDATPEVLAKYTEWQAQRSAERDAARRKIVSVHCMVRIIKGKHTGQEGVVTWKGVDKFSKYREQRIRVQPDNGEAFFTAYKNAEVI